MDPRIRHAELLHETFQAKWFERDYKAALLTATDELAAAQEAHGSEHPAVVRAWLDLGLAHEAHQAPEPAVAAGEKAQALLERLQSQADRFPDHPGTADLILFEADRLWNLTGDTPEVMQKIQRAVSIREKHFGAGHSATARALARLAEVEDLRAHFADAAFQYRRAVNVFDAAQETDDPYLEKSLEGLGRSLLQLKRPAEAWPCLERALAWAERYGYEKRPLYYLLTSAAQCRQALGDPSGAARYESRALALLPKANPGAEGFHV